jgi:hypothetical protein
MSAISVDNLPFPELDRISTFDTIPCIAIGVNVAVVSFFIFAKHSWKVAWIVAGGIIAVAVLPGIAKIVRTDLSNGRARRQWAQFIGSRVSMRQLQSLVMQAPDRYVLHVHYYSGFDVAGIPTAVIVEDMQSGTFSALFPARAVDSLAAKCGVSIVKH